MLKRTYRLFAKDDGPYEIVPTGWSFLAALLGPFWAIANGVFRPFFWLVFLPTLPVLAIAEALRSPLVAWVWMVGAFWIVFPLFAFRWREHVLRKKRYKLIVSVAATSSKEALRCYAETVA